jgi:hypothetical protein
MSARRCLLWLTVLGLWCGSAIPADAHRLDETLEATRISIDRERVGLELDVTPGISAAPQLLASIDTDADGHLSLAERDEYVREFVHGLALTIDGTPVAVVLRESEFPELVNMSLGVGAIRVRAIGVMPAEARAIGRHIVSYAGRRGSGQSAYLVNALVPADPRIEIVQQGRDQIQRVLTLEYRVLPDAQWTRLSWSAMALAMIGLLGWARTRGRVATNGQSDLVRLGATSPVVVRAR